MRKALGGVAYLLAAVLTLPAPGTISRIIRGESLANGELLGMVLCLAVASGLCALGFIAFNPKGTADDDAEG